MGSMLPYIAAPWIRHGLSNSLNQTKKRLPWPWAKWRFTNFNRPCLDFLPHRAFWMPFFVTQNEKKTPTKTFKLKHTKTPSQHHSTNQILSQSPWSVTGSLKTGRALPSTIASPVQKLGAVGGLVVGTLTCWNPICQGTALEGTFLSVTVHLLQQSATWNIMTWKADLDSGWDWCRVAEEYSYTYIYIYIVIKYHKSMGHVESNPLLLLRKSSNPWEHAPPILAATAVTSARAWSKAHILSCPFVVLSPFWQYFMLHILKTQGNLGRFLDDLNGITIY